MIQIVFRTSSAFSHCESSCWWPNSLTWVSKSTTTITTKRWENWRPEIHFIITPRLKIFGISHDGAQSRDGFALDENCWVCAKWLLHSTVARLTCSPFLFQDWNGEVTVECSNHFAHAQQFSSNANPSLAQRRHACRSDS